MIGKWPVDKNTPLAYIPSSPNHTRWTKVGYRGTSALPASNEITNEPRCTISAIELGQPPYNVIPNDGIDDSAGLQAAIDYIGKTCPGSFDRLSLIELPQGVVNISTEIHVDVSYLIIRGQGTSDYSATTIKFRPGPDTVYDEVGDFNLNLMRAADNASGTWIWPGRGAFRVQTRAVHPDYADSHASAATNRKDFYEGSVNFHWKSGVDLAQSAFEGDNVLRLDDVSGFSVGDHVWVGIPNSDLMYDLQGVRHDERVCGYMRQQVFAVTDVRPSSNVIAIDGVLEFDALVDSPSEAMNSVACTESASKVKVVRLNVVRGVGFENFVLTQPMDDLMESSARNNYRNLSPERAMHGIVFKWAADGFVRNIRTHYTGSHPIVTEISRHMQFQDNIIHGSWNKGKGGNGYFRNSKLWDSLIVGNKITDVRHLTLQWSASGNVVKSNTMDCDLNLHGGWERHNLLEQNVVNVPHDHRDCNPVCNSEDGNWYPIFWAAGVHGGGWSGATGPRNVFFNNILTTQRREGGPFETYFPYGANPHTVYQFGWDHITAAGLGWEHLSINGAHIKEWTQNEEVLYMLAPNEGVNSNCTHSGASLIGIEYESSCSSNEGQVLSIADVPTKSEWCHGGAIGGPGDQYCCAASCYGQCGGTGCSGLPGGASQCCSSEIEEFCMDSSDTVCIIPSWCHGGAVGGPGDRYCCGASCNGRCGGTGCSGLPGGASECCTSTIERVCTDLLDTVCIIP